MQNHIDVLQHRNGEGLQKAAIHNSDVEKRNIVVDENGAIIFKSLKTLSQIPAGEYIPTRDRSNHGVLLPVKRNQRVDSNSTITEKENYDNGDYHNSNLKEDLDSLLEMSYSETSDYGLDSRSLENDFMPVHSYFPMEKYNKGLQSAKQNINRFLNSKDIYRDLKMDYRRGILLYGDPGTGKSQFIYQLTKELIQNWEAIVIRLEGSGALNNFYDYVINSLSGLTRRLKVVVIEELADLCSSRSNLSVLLSLLDSMVFRENVLFLITTNYPEKIPSNIVDRPARLDLLCPIYSKDYGEDFIDDWYRFCMGKPITDDEKNQSWYTEANGKLSPAYYKELFIYSQLHNTTVNKAWEVIKKRRIEIQNDFNNSHAGGIGFNI